MTAATDLTLPPHVAHGGRIDALARQLGCRPEAILDLSASVNPLGPPAGVVARLADPARLAARLACYPDPDQEPLRSRLAAAASGGRGLAAQQVLVGHGATELLRLALAALGPAMVAVPQPAYEEYARLARLVGAEIELMPTPLDEGDGADRPLPRPAAPVAIVGAPANPTGALPAPGRLAQLAHGLWRRGGRLVWDAAFVDWLPDPDAYLREAADPAAIVIRSMTKLYAIPGLRLGWAEGPPEVIEAMRRLQDPWSVSSLALDAGEACLDDPDFAVQSRTWLAAERPVWAAMLAARGWRVWPSAANYLFADPRPAGETAGAVAERLAAERVLVRVWTGSGAAGCLRVAVGTAAQRTRFAAALDAAASGPHARRPAGRGAPARGQRAKTR